MKGTGFFYHSPSVVSLVVQLVRNCCQIFFFISFKFFMKVNEIKVKKGVELAQHLVEFYYAQVT